MASQAEAKTIDDVVRAEWNQDYCRDEITVSNGVTVAVGDACTLDGSEELILAKFAVTNEVQLVAVAGTLASGTGKIGIVHAPSGTGPEAIPGTRVWTMPIAFNATTAAATTAIDLALGGTNLVVVTGTIWSAMVLTFSGTGYAGLPQPMAEIDEALIVGSTTVDVTQTTEGRTVGGDVTHVCLAAVVGNGTLKAITLARGPAIINSDQLAIVSGGKANSIAALKKVGIIGRDQPANQSTGI